uniref:Uncharacterized protein n=2 Tax=Clastoptera arizonana TaxID=38151 RepID=A0A1B6EAE6_9HEMI
MTTGNPRRGKKQQHPVNPRPQQCNEEDDPSRSPLTRLAIHTQGAPLIQAGRYNHNRPRNNYCRDPPGKVFQSGDIRRADVVKSMDSSARSSDSVSVASDESSANSENSLPRIIKPRKRRKKDRKPPIGQADGVQNSAELENKVSPVVTLKPYMPLCFESFGARTPSEPHDLKNEKPDETVPEVYRSVEDLIDTPQPNLLDEEDDNRSDPSPATLCQCRYCDPSGIIWDVDRSCYSPYLTPPSPAENRFHFNSLPLYYETPDHKSRYFDQRPFLPYSFDGDLGSILRRTWSDSSSDAKSEDLQRFACHEDDSEGLQVSSEIVTSPNGHRDIEIKFYSSSSPPKSTTRTRSELCFSDKDYYDKQLFVPEE